MRMEAVKGCSLFRLVAFSISEQVLSDDLLRSSYNTSGEGGLGHDWWPDDPEARILFRSCETTNHQIMLCSGWARTPIARVRAVVFRQRSGHGLPILHPSRSRQIPDRRLQRGQQDASGRSCVPHPAHVATRLSFERSSRIFSAGS